MAHCRGKVVLGRKAAAGTKTQCRCNWSQGDVCSWRSAGNDVAAFGLLGDPGSFLSAPSWWSVGHHKQELHVPISYIHIPAS